MGLEVTFKIMFCNSIDFTLGWVYIKIQIQEVWRSKHPLTNLTCELKVEPNLEDCFFKLEDRRSFF